MSAREPQVGDTITTAEELDLALAEGPLDARWFLIVSTPERGDEIAWTCFADEDGDVWAVRPASEDDPPEVVEGVQVQISAVPLPITIVATSDTRPRPERVVKAEALREAAARYVRNQPGHDWRQRFATWLRTDADRIERGDA